jgi:CRP-like cAMP-binding protein
MYVTSDQRMAQPKNTLSQNRILASLPAAEFERISSHLVEVSLPLGEIIHRPEQKIEYVYFPENSLVSLLAVLEDGETVEAGVIGYEGFVGVPVVLGVQSGTTQALIQGAGDAQRIKSQALRSLINDGGQLQGLLLRFAHTLFTQVAQTAACNRAHDLNQRLARWLLLSHDRLRKEEFILTHEFLSRMLGTRRAGVSVAANGLRQGGLIDYTRGRVRIKNRKGLEQASCECYGIVKADYDALFKA